MSMIGRLLRRNLSAAQLAGYAVANLAGLVIVACAIMFYTAVDKSLGKGDSFLSKDYLIVSKRVSSFGDDNGANAFNEAELQALESQPWVRQVGRFQSADFGVQASVDFAGRGMATSLFLESVPDGYLDVSPRNWQWAPGDAVPVIMSRDYLTLYNFGFAATRGLPQISEAMMGSVPLQLTLTGNGRAEQFKARIVGFSSRLNTIAVPQRFMEWAQGNFGTGEAVAPSRVIVDVKSPGDPAITRYMDAHGYQVGGDKADSGRASYLLGVAAGIAASVGAVITLLAFFILMLSLYLLMQKNRLKMHMLMQLGYTPAQVARWYCRLVCLLNGAVLVCACCAVTGVGAWALPRLAEAGVEASLWPSIWPAIAAAAILTVAVTAVNMAVIRSKVRAAFR